MHNEGFSCLSSRLLVEIKGHRCPFATFWCFRNDFKTHGLVLRIFHTSVTLTRHIKVKVAAKGQRPHTLCVRKRYFDSLLINKIIN